MIGNLTLRDLEIILAAFHFWESEGGPPLYHGNERVPYEESALTVATVKTMRKEHGQ